MTTQAAMQHLGEIDGWSCYWAEPGRFEVPGFYFWDGARNVHVPLLRGIHLVRNPDGKTEVAIEVGDKWVTVISEAGDIISHIVEHGGIDAAIAAAE
jgi:hypothetical protein